MRQAVQSTAQAVREDQYYRRCRAADKDAGEAKQSSQLHTLATCNSNVALGRAALDGYYDLGISPERRGGYLCSVQLTALIDVLSD